MKTQKALVTLATFLKRFEAANKDLCDTDKGWMSSAGAATVLLLLLWVVLLSSPAFFRVVVFSALVLWVWWSFLSFLKLWCSPSPFFFRVAFFLPSDVGCVTFFSFLLWG